MSIEIVGIALLVVLIAFADYKSSPMCRWCQCRHRGRCIYNPRAGRIMAHANDRHFNYDDPNQ